MSSRHYYFVSKYSGKCLFQGGRWGEENELRVNQKECMGEPNFHIEVIPETDGYYYLRFKNSEKCIAPFVIVRREGYGMVSDIKMVKCDTSDFADRYELLWQFEDVDNVYSRLITELDVTGTSVCLLATLDGPMDNQSVMAMEQCNSPKALWTFLPVGSDIRAINSNSSNNNSNRTTSSERGWLVIETIPSGALVQLNNQIVGSTPIQKLEVPARDYIIEISLKGYESVNKEITVGKNEEISLWWDLR